ncbi:antibiotic biosynthesis monooxygenase [Hansschlegelia beijingensis]
MELCCDAEYGRTAGPHYVAAMKLVSTVFEVAPEHAAAFRAAVFANANAVERNDPACRGVAIAEDPSTPGFFLTSALYETEAAADEGYLGFGPDVPGADRAAAYETLGPGSRSRSGW